MMTNLFSIFDPHTSNNMTLNWMTIFLFIFIIPYSLFLTNPLSHSPMKKIMSSIISEYNSMLSINKQGSLLFFSSIFILVMSMNTLGLFPFIFTPSSHIFITLSMSLVMWLMIMLKNISMKTNHLLAHLVPQGTPLLLSFFMVIIESISLLIRPITLSIRLTANMIAGHLLLSLISSTASLNPKNFITSMTTQTMMIILETAVALIQAFVFSTLIMLYSAE